MALRSVKSQEHFRVIWLGKSGLREGPHELPRATETDGSNADIRWTGPLPHPDVSRVMAACDLFALPFTDGVSTKRGTLAAALLHGLPIITTRGRQVDGMFVHRENIYLVPRGDVRAFADGLRELARRPELRTRLALGARALHDAWFSWDTIARQVARSAERA
jgi:glycosyltransferase involved in cell wall biosynthesis